MSEWAKLTDELLESLNVLKHWVLFWSIFEWILFCDWFNLFARSKIGAGIFKLVDAITVELPGGDRVPENDEKLVTGVLFEWFMCPIAWAAADCNWLMQLL